MSVFDTKDTPRFYPYGDKYNAGMAHVLMHRATEAAGIERRGRNDGLSTSELTSCIRRPIVIQCLMEYMVN